MSTTQQQSLAGSPLFPLYLFLGTFLAYIWATPLRDLFGLEAKNGLFTKIMVSNGPSLVPTLMGTSYADYPPMYFWLSWLFSLPAGQVTTVSAVLPSAMAAEAMLVEPWVSQRESGRDFVRQTEADIAPTIPVVLYKINPDGDGIKYAMYSSRPSEDLFFAHNPAELGSPPCLLC